MEEKKAEIKRRKEEQALNRVLLWFGSAVFFELYILMIDRVYVSYGTMGALRAYRFGQALFVLGFVFAACAAGFAVWRAVWKKAGRSVLVPTTGAVGMAALSGSTFVALHWYGKGVALLFATGFFVAVLAMIYYLYQREFFAIAAMAGGGLLCMWLLRMVANQKPLVYAAFAGLGAFTLVIAVLARVLQRKNGVLTLRGRDRRILPKGSAYPMVYIGCAMTAAALGAAAVFGAVAAYYMMYALGAWIFIMAVYFTVKLM